VIKTVLQRWRRERPAPEPPAPPAAPPQVVVLGMHRSGTSAITALLRLLGLWAGEAEDFPPADEHNPAGYWEHRGVWAVNEAILHALGVSWSAVAELDLTARGEELLPRFGERAREVVRELDRHGPWVVKDPRLCLLFPFWRQILADPFCVLIHRDPLPVARSLAARDGLALPHGIALWERYTRDALDATRGLPRVLISHRELMARPAATLERLRRELAGHRPELARLRLPGPEEIRGVLDPDLLHHADDRTSERSYLTLTQLALLDALADGSALGLDPVPPLSPGARELLAAYEGLRELANAKAAAVAKRDRALAWVDEADAILAATFASRSWRIGRAVTTLLGLRGRSRLSSDERRERLMAEVRSRPRGDAGE
jgi:hypothetical protein